MTDEVYLGDAVYAKFDGYHIQLWTSDGIRKTNEIFMEPDVLHSFEQYVSRLRELIATANGRV